MSHNRRGLFAVVLGAAAFVLAGCQGGAKQSGQTSGPQKKSVGGTIQADPAGGKFVVSGNRGTYTVDMAGSAVVRNNKPIDAGQLKEGAFIIVNGTLQGDILKASKITLMHDKDQMPLKPVAAGTQAGG